MDLSLILKSSPPPATRKNRSRSTGRLEAKKLFTLQYNLLPLLLYIYPWKLNMLAISPCTRYRNGGILKPLLGSKGILYSGSTDRRKAAFLVWNYSFRKTVKHHFLILLNLHPSFLVSTLCLSFFVTIFLSGGGALSYFCSISEVLSPLTAPHWCMPKTAFCFFF